MWPLRAWFLVLGVVITSGPGACLSAACPLQLLPGSAVVVRFGDPLTVNCSTSEDVFQVMGWEVPVGNSSTSQGTVKFVTWSVASLKMWSIQPKCYITVDDDQQCGKKLEVTVYKLPDSVSIFAPHLAGVMEAGRSYQLQCDVRDVATVRNLSVVWYRGSEVIHNETRDSVVATPRNESFHVTVTPQKDDQGVRFLCQVEMKGISSLSKRSPIITSEPYNMVVHYPPSFFSPLPETLDPVVDEEPVLNCSADGNPPPTYHWWSSAGLPEAMTGNNSVLRTSSPLPPGTYNCTASNPLASVTKVFIVLPRSQRTFVLTVVLCSALAVVILGATFWATRKYHGCML